VELERRFVPVDELDLRVDDDGPAKIAGYSARFDIWTNIGPFMERVEPGAFTETRENDDVRALFNHDPNIVLGRTSNETLELREDDKGLFMENTPPDTQAARDVVALIQRGDVTGQSYGFSVLEDEWETKEIEGEPVEHRTVKKVKLFDVGPVTFPAEEATSIQTRSAEAVLAEHRTTVAGGPDDEGGGDDGLESDETPRFTSRDADIRIKEYVTETG
jgi:HK97 family phage prohead protease